MRKIEFKSIKRKLIASMVALVVISCVVLAAVSTMSARSTVEGEILGTFDAVGGNSAGQMSLIFQAGLDSANLFATRTPIIDLLETEMKSGVNKEKRDEQNKAIDKANKLTSDAFTNIMIVNLQGEVIACNLPENIGTSYKDNPLFTEGKKGNYVSDPFLNNKKEATIGYSAPVHDADGKEIGVIINTGPMAYLEKIVLDPSGLGSTAKGMIVDINREGPIISHVKGAEDAFLVKKAKIAQIQEGKLNY
jgi:hypothetical protein